MTTRQSRIYLDNAATTWPKPEAVYQAVDDYQRNIGASAGRGSYSDALRAREIVDLARDRLSQLFRAPADSQFVFAFNGTDGLNICLHGMLHEPCHVVTSVIEHNSVLRPLRTLADRLDIRVSYADCDADGVVSVDAIRTQLRPDTRLVVLSHASNVTGMIQPIEEIGSMLHEHRIRLLVDAAQTAGHLKINLSELPVDLLVSSGHKGLLGPLGTGVVYFGPTVADSVRSFRQGGTGSQSDLDIHPDDGISKFEAGNLNMPGIAGLAAALDYVLAHEDAIRQHELQLTERLLQQLSKLPNVRLLGSRHCNQRVGVVSFQVDGFDCHEVASILETAHGIQVRAGLVCAPRVHASLNAQQGSVRASLGPFSVRDEIDALCSAMKDLC